MVYYRTSIPAYNHAFHVCNVDPVTLQQTAVQLLDFTWLPFASRFPVSLCSRWKEAHTHLNIAKIRVLSIWVQLSAVYQ